MKIEEVYMYRHDYDVVLEEDGKRHPGKQTCVCLSFTDEELETMKPPSPKNTSLNDLLDRATLANTIFEKILAHLNRKKY